MAKRCVRCGIEKPTSEFHARSIAKDGLQAACKGCRADRRRARRSMTDADRAAEAAAIVQRTEKTCGACGECKPRADFRARAASRDGMVSRCKACEQDARRKHYRRTKGKALARSAEWYAKNKARKNATSRAYYVENAERVAEARREWLARNPGYMAEFMRRRRATLRGVVVGKVDLDALWTGDCGICDDPIDGSLRYPDPMSKSLDHIFPVSRGGAHEQSNLQWAHLICNVRKGARILTADEGVA